ncbi:MAG: SDR family NAD(P)-dependent oxidoreductase, partial [Armatimonadetes bacterium]|nr:SDR family NAD(P)-dependent oxidoreductase [Armatimonadota bacterium]
MNVLITGGAGFIGTHLARRLLQEGCAVTVLDNFSPQIHGAAPALAADLAGHVRLVAGDVRDRDAFHQALAGQEAVVHLAAETGTGQSMYEVSRYEEVNVKGTAVLMDFLVNHPGSAVQKVVTASSRAVYGEGKYRCPQHGVVYPAGRDPEAMAAGRFEPPCPHCDADCAPLPTDESAPFAPTSFYGLTKQVQEQMTLLFARARGLSAFGLRYQNVYGPGQSLHNPYTGILAVFSNRARACQPIYVFEDGLESRDFVYIDDVVEATWRCLRPEARGVEALNVGSGIPTTVAEVVREIIAFFGSRSDVSITGEFRLGDIRHNVADLARVRQALGFSPRWPFARGIA